MKQVLQDRTGQTIVREVPAPECPIGSLLVRNTFSAISSGTERARVEASKKSLFAKALERPDVAREVVDRARREGIRKTHELITRKLEEAFPVGYSSAGHVVEVGAAVAGLDVGDAVACAGAGHANHAEIVSVPANLCAKVPPGVATDVASLTAIASIALHAVRLADTRIGERVAVIGCGLVGQIAVRLLHTAGVEAVALDTDPLRIEQSLAGGAAHAFVADRDAVHRVIDVTNGVGVDAALVTAAAATSGPLVTAVGIARDRGRVVLVGDVPIDLPRASMYQKELSFRVSRSYGPGRYDREYEERGLDYPIGFVRWTEKRNMEAVLALEANRRLDLGDLIEEIVPIEEAARAYARLGAPPHERPRGALLLAYAETSSSTVVPLTLSVAGRPPRRTPLASSQTPVRIGVIGPGAFASRVLVPAFAKAGARLEVVGGGSGPSAEAMGRELGFARVAPSAESIFADDGIDAIVITTRHSSHADLTIRALKADKHVFCEKPLALSREELDAVMGAAADARRIVTVGFNRRFSPLLRELRGFLATAGSRIAVSYRVSAGPIDPAHWTHDLGEGGGRILGEVCHFVDSLSFLVACPICSVYATGFGAPKLPIQARDTIVADLTFADGSVGSILYAADGSPALPKERLEAHTLGRAGMLDDYRALELLGPSGTRRIRPRKQEKGHLQEVEAFLRGVEEGEPPVDLDELANVTLATIALVESMRTGLPVDLQA